jgi:hypothetical protein
VINLRFLNENYHCALLDLSNINAYLCMSNMFRKMLQFISTKLTLHCVALHICKAKFDLDFLRCP